MNRDGEHLNLLSIFHYVVGGLTILGSCIFLIYVGMGIAMLCGAFGNDRNAPPRALGWLFLSIGSAAVIIGWTIGILIIVAGVKLRKRASRVFCLVIAAIECLVQPLGTVLGVFTIVVLERESVAVLFKAGASPPPQSPLPTEN